MKTQTGIVDTDWLAQHIDDPKVKVLDASYGGPNVRKSFEGKHIPGAQFFYIDEIADQSNPLPHMLPTADQFAQQVSALGISNDDQIIVYDQTGIFLAACRCWWMFRVFGHDNIAVLDGGLPTWIAEKHPMSNDGGGGVQEAGTFSATIRPHYIASKDDIVRGLTGHNHYICDARDKMRFNGLMPESGSHMRRGHIPGSVNVPFKSLIAKNGTLKPQAELADILQKHKILGADKPVISTCGSGVTACVLALASHIAGGPDIAVYDGSWTEWGQDHDMPASAAI